MEMKWETPRFVEIQRFPMSMTGKKLRKKLGIADKPIFGEPFRVARRFQKIKPEDRLGFLVREASKSTGISLSWKELRQKRDGFNRGKVKRFGLSKATMCWCCQKEHATLRHHVRPLLKGGRNKVNNIVPLCRWCHGKIHPHLRG